MKSKIRVKPVFGGHQIYQEIVNYPPLNVIYLGVSKETKEGNYYQSKRFKEFLGRILQFIKIPRLVFVRPGKYDIIHSSRGIIPLNNKPWVIDMEHVHSFFGLNPNLIKNRFWKKFIEMKLGSKNCKAILCHCEATRQAFFHYLDCSKFKHKIKVMYPASHITPIKHVPSKNIRILAVLSLFKLKGGPQILKAFSELIKKHKNIELIIKADVSDSLKKKYSTKIKYIPFHSNIVPREDLLKDLYSQADIFLYPTFCDSFGYSFIDAMVAELPIITTNLFASPEIVLDGVNGFVIKIPGYNLKPDFLQVYPAKKIKGRKEREVIDQIKSSIEKLILNPDLLKKMSVESSFLVRHGSFSLEHRNKILKEVYEGALKK